MTHDVYPAGSAPEGRRPWDKDRPYDKKARRRLAATKRRETEAFIDTLRRPGDPDFPWRHGDAR